MNRYIDADALKKEIDYTAEIGDFLSIVYKAVVDSFKKRIDEQPTADVRENVQGEWKWADGGMCSECGFHNSNFDFNFCPKCGADMRKGETNG